MNRRDAISLNALSSGVTREANRKERHSAEDRYDIARAMSDYSSKNRSKQSSSEEDFSGTDASGSSYETASDDESSEDFEDGHDDMPDGDIIKHRDSEDLSVDSLPLLGGWLDRTCGWLDQPTACTGGRPEASLLRECKMKAIPRVKRIENFVRTRRIVSRKQKRSQHLEAKGVADSVKTDNTRTVVTISLCDQGKDENMHVVLREESVQGSPVPFIHEDTSVPVSPIPGIGHQISVASLEPKGEEKLDRMSAHSRSHHSPADRSQRSSRSNKSQNKEQDRDEKDAAELTEFSNSWADSPLKKERSPKGKSNDLADIDGLYLPESEDILSTSIKESRSKSRSKKSEEESRSTRSERASLRNDHDSTRSERASMRSGRSSGRVDKGSSRGERTSAREEPNITDLSRSTLALPGNPSQSPGKMKRPEDVHVIEVLEIDSQDSWTPGKDMENKSGHSRRSRISIDPEARVIDDDIEGHVTDLWQEEEEKLKRASSRGRAGRVTRTIALEDEDGSKLWAQEKKKVEEKGLTNEVDLADDSRGRRETRTHGIELSRSKSIGASSKHSRKHRSKSRDPDGHTHREHFQFQSPDPSEEKTTPESKRENGTVAPQPDPSPRPVANLEHRQKALESRSPEVDPNFVSDLSDQQKRISENAGKRMVLREQEMKREALAHDQVNDGDGIRKSKSHDLRESTGRDRLRSVSRSKSRNDLREQSHGAMVVPRSKSRDAREATPNSQVDTVLESKSGPHLRENDAISHGIRPARSRDLQDAGDAQDVRNSGAVEVYNASRGRDMRSLNPSRSKSSGRSKSRDHRSAEDREPAVQKSKSREIREIVEASDIEYAAPQPLRSNSPNKSMRQSRSLDVRESRRSDIPELAARGMRSKSRGRVKTRDIDDPSVSPKSRHSLELNSPTKSVHESKSREVLEEDIRKNRSRDVRESLDQDAGLRHSKSREERKREKRGKNPEALNAAKELRRLEKRLEKQLKQVKREQVQSELNKSEHEPQWDDQSASAVELRRMENERARMLKRDDEKRASKLKRLRQKPEFSKGQYESYETPNIQDKVRSQAQSKTVAQKVVDTRGRSEDGTRSSKAMSKHYSKFRTQRNHQDEADPRYD